MSDHFKITNGDSEFGSCDYGITINDKSWGFYASYLGKHPLYDHIHTAIDLYDCIVKEPIFDQDKMTWVCCSVDEPGEIRIKLQIKNNALKIDVHHFIGSLQSTDENNILVAQDITIELMDYLQAVVYASAYAINLQGLMGLTEGFGCPTIWDIDGHVEIIPYGLFLYLATIVRYGEPKTHIGLHEEYSLIIEMAAKYQAT